MDNGQLTIIIWQAIKDRPYIIFYNAIDSERFWCRRRLKAEVVSCILRGLQNARLRQKIRCQKNEKTPSVISSEGDIFREVITT